AGKVKQLITGSTGLDDAEWGVTLFARDTFQIKKIVYEMRFDPVSAEYADFGEFFVGIQLPLDELFRRLQLYLVLVLIIDRSNDYEQDSKGWVTERSIVHAWKACVPQGTRGSNPLPSAPFLFLTPARNRNRNRGISADRACSLSVNPAETLRCVREAPRRECLPRDK